MKNINFIKKESNNKKNIIKIKYSRFIKYNKRKISYITILICKRK